MCFRFTLFRRAMDFTVFANVTPESRILRTIRFSDRCGGRCPGRSLGFGYVRTLPAYAAFSIFLVALSVPGSRRRSWFFRDRILAALTAEAILCHLFGVCLLPSSRRRDDLLAVGEVVRVVVLPVVCAGHAYDSSRRARPLLDVIARPAALSQCVMNARPAVVTWTIPLSHRTWPDMTMRSSAWRLLPPLPSISARTADSVASGPSS